jgi:hypothetical protein
MLSRVANFRKRFTCPSAEMLCAYQAGTVSDAQKLWIYHHLTTCDFCHAEFRLLAEHPPAEEYIQPSEMPPHVRSLAESLLRPDLFTLERWAEGAFLPEPTLSDA